MLLKLTEFHGLIKFTSQDIGQYVYYNFLLTRLWCHKIWNKTYLSYQAALLHDQKVKTKT